MVLVDIKASLLLDLAADSFTNPSLEKIRMLNEWTN